MERSEALWSTLERETDAGAVESRQWIMVPRELVASDEGGARELGRRYLAEVARFSHVSYARGCGVTAWRSSSPAP